MSAAAIVIAAAIAMVAPSAGCVDGATADCSDANTYCGPEAAVDSGAVGDALTDGSKDAVTGDAPQSDAGPSDAGDASDAASDALGTDAADSATD